MRNLLPNLRGLFFCFQCLPCCKPNTRSDTSPLLDDEGNPQEEPETVLPFGEQVRANAEQDDSPGRDYHKSPAGSSDSRSSFCKIS